MGLSISSCFNPVVTTGSLGASTVTVTTTNFGIINEEVTPPLFNLTWEFTTNHQVDPQAAIWINFCDNYNKCSAPIPTTKQNLVSGVFMNFTDYSRVSSLKIDVTAAHVVGPSENLIVTTTSAQICSGTSCYGQLVCPQNQQFNTTAVSSVCGNNTEKLFANNNSTKSKNLRFSDFGVGPVNADASKLFLLIIAYSNNLKPGYTISNLEPDLVNVTYRSGVETISETISRSKLSSLGLFIHGSEITEVKLSWNVASGTDSFTITNFQVCDWEMQICQGLQTCAPSNEFSTSMTLDYSSMQTTTSTIMPATTTEAATTTPSTTSNGQSSSTPAQVGTSTASSVSPAGTTTVAPGHASSLSPGGTTIPLPQITDATPERTSAPIISSKPLTSRPLSSSRKVFIDLTTKAPSKWNTDALKSSFGSLPTQTQSNSNTMQYLFVLLVLSIL